MFFVCLTVFVLIRMCYCIVLCVRVRSSASVFFVDFSQAGSPV